MSVASTRYRPHRPIGDLLREWRQRRQLSQLDLAIQAEISARHLSFVETGRSKPTSEMILRLTEHLDVPLRDRNTLLLAGGYAPAYPENRLDGPELAAVRGALRHVLAGHEPYPAVVVNRWWELADGNAAVSVLTEGAAPELLAPPVNALRLSLHPDGMAPRIDNLAEYSAHLLTRLHRQAVLSADPALAALHEELRQYPGVASAPSSAVDPAALLFVPLRLRTPDGHPLTFFSTVATFGTALDITMAELAIESFFPADAATETFLRGQP